LPYLEPLLGTNEPFPFAFIDDEAFSAKKLFNAALCKTRSHQQAPTAQRQANDNCNDYVFKASTNTYFKNAETFPGCLRVLIHGLMPWQPGNLFFNAMMMYTKIHKIIMKELMNIWTTFYLVLQYHKEFLIIGYLELEEQLRMPSTFLFQNGLF